MSRNHWITIGGLIVGLLLLTFLGWRFLVHPLAADYAAAVAQEQALDQQLQTARDTAAQFSKFKIQAENMSRELGFYSSRVDGSLDTVSVMALLSDLAQPLNLKRWTCRIKAQAPRRGGASAGSFADVEVTFDSDFESLGRFLNACVGERRIIVPRGIFLSALNDPNGLYQETLSVDLVLLVYGSQTPSAGVR